MNQTKVLIEYPFYLLLTLSFCRCAMPNESPPLDLHFGVFMPTIEMQGTDEQKKRWLQKAQDMKIIGAYGQTELGHG